MKKRRGNEGTLLELLFLFVGCGARERRRRGGDGGGREEGDQTPGPVV